MNFIIIGFLSSAYAWLFFILSFISFKIHFEKIEVSKLLMEKGNLSIMKASLFLPSVFNAHKVTPRTLSPHL